MIKVFLLPVILDKCKKRVGLTLERLIPYAKGTLFQEARAPLIRDFGKPMYAKKFGYDVTVRLSVVRTSALLCKKRKKREKCKKRFGLTLERLISYAKGTLFQEARAPLIRDFGKPMYAKKFGYDVTVRLSVVRTSALL